MCAGASQNIPEHFVAYQGGQLAAIARDIGIIIVIWAVGAGALKKIFSVAAGKIIRKNKNVLIELIFDAK
jgi:hypothetical protein